MMLPRRRASACASGDRGAAAVEFALVMPLLLLLICGVVDFARAWNMQLAMSHGAREGVRVLALGGTAADAQTRTQSAALPVTGMTVTPSVCPAVPTPTDDARITATRTYDYITPISEILNLMGQPGLAAPTITGRGRMRCNG